MLFRSAILTFKNSLPLISSFTYDQVKISLENSGREFENLLSSKNTKDINASSFTKGSLSSSDIYNLSHNYYSRYNQSCEYVPTKHLLSGVGSTFFYPENLSSDLQYNLKIYNIFESTNFGTNNILYLTERGLMQSDTTLKNVKLSSSFNNDLGRPVKIQDNILHPEDFNYFKETYISILSGKLFYTNNDGLTWLERKLPYNDQNQQVKVIDFDISTERVQVSDIEYYYVSNLYIVTIDGLFYARIKENQTEDNWNWVLINRFALQSYINYYPDNLTSCVEIVTKNTEIVSGEADLVTYDRTLYLGSISDISPGLYVGNASGMDQILSEPVTGLHWIRETDVDTRSEEHTSELQSH